MSRTSSTNTILQVQKSSAIIPESLQADIGLSSPTHERARNGQNQHAVAVLRPRTPSQEARNPSSSSSASSESEDEAPLLRSKAYTRRPRLVSSKAPLGPLSDADEDSEDSPPFLPFSDRNAIRKATLPSADPGATVRMSPRLQKAHLVAPSAPNKSQGSPASMTAHSSSSSVQSQPASREAQPSAPRAPLSSLSPRQRRIAKEGSDGTPSMGSSFSDLDDASVTKSALEEALANEMRHGGVASRMSTISQALRSRYL